MGTVQSSPELSDHALKANTTIDTHVLQYSFDDLTDIAWLARAYTETIHTGAITLTHDTHFRLKKLHALAKKNRDFSVVLASALFLSSHSNTEFYRKQLKILERAVAELAASADPYADILRARCALIQRVQLAYLRTRHRQELEGKPHHCSGDDKRQWLAALLKGGEESESLLVNGWLTQFERDETAQRAKEEEAHKRSKRREAERAIERARENIRQRIGNIRAHVWQQQSASLSAAGGITQPRLFFPPLPVVTQPSSSATTASALPSDVASSAAAPSSSPQSLAAASSSENISSPPRSPAPSSISLSSLSSPSVPSPVLSALSAPLSPALSSSSLISEADEKKVPSLHDEHTEQKERESKTDDSENDTFLQSVLQHADSLPELIGITGLLGVFHPREKLIHNEQLIQRRWLERHGAQRRGALESQGSGSASSLFARHPHHLLRRGPMVQQRVTDANVGGHDIDDGAEMEERTAARVAELGVQAQSISAFIRQARSAINAVGDNASATLHLAASSGNVDLVSTLLRHGAPAGSDSALLDDAHDDDIEDQEDVDDEEDEHDEHDEPLHDHEHDDGHDYGSVPDSHEQDPHEHDEQQNEEEDDDDDEEDDDPENQHDDQDDDAEFDQHDDQFDEPDFDPENDAEFGAFFASAHRGRGRGGHHGRGDRARNPQNDLDIAMMQSLQTHLQERVGRAAASVESATATAARQPSTAPAASSASSSAIASSFSTVVASPAPVLTSAAASSATSAAAAPSFSMLNFDAELAAAMAADDDPEMLQAIALSLGLDRAAAPALAPALETTVPAASSPASSAASSAAPGSAAIASAAAPSQSRAAVEVVDANDEEKSDDEDGNDEELRMARALSLELTPITPASDVSAISNANTSMAPAAFSETSSSQLTAPAIVPPSAPAVTPALPAPSADNMDLDAELAASLLNGEDAELARAIALSLQMARESEAVAPALAPAPAPALAPAPAPAAAVVPATTVVAAASAVPTTTNAIATTATSSASSSALSTASTSTPSTVTAEPSAALNEALDNDLVSQLDRLSDLLQQNQRLLSQMTERLTAATAGAQMPAAAAAPVPRGDQLLEEMIRQAVSGPLTGTVTTPTTLSASATTATSDSVPASSASSLETHERELSALLGALSGIRQQLRQRRQEDRQQQFASGLLSTQRQDEQHLLVMVNELEEQVRELQEQCRRLVREVGPESEATANARPIIGASGVSAGVSAPHTISQSHSDRHGPAWMGVSAGVFGGASQTGATAGLTRPAARRTPDLSAPLDDNDMHFNAYELILLVLKEASAQSEALVDSVTEAVSPLKTARATKSLPSVRLLSLLQRDFYRKAALATTASDAVVPQFVHFVRSLIEQGQTVLGRVAAKAEAIVHGEVDSLLSQCLYQTIIGSCLPMTVLVAFNLVQTPAFASLAQSITSPLRRLINDLNAVTKLFSSSRTLDVADSTRPSLSPDCIRVVESSHAYMPVMDNESVISIPGADCLVLEFDQRCSTERGRDVLDVMSEDRALIGSFDGDLGSWPSTPLIVNGSSVILRFHAESANAAMRFGYRITITGMAFPTPPPAKRITPSNNEPAAGASSAAAAEPKPDAKSSDSSKPSRSEILSEIAKTRLPSPSLDPSILMHTNPFLYDLLNLSCRLFGRCARLLIVGDELSAEEKSHSKWLSSPLFSQGFEKDHSAAEASITIPTASEPPVAEAEIEPVQLDDRIATTNNINAASNLNPANNTTSTTATPTVVPSVSISNTEDRATARIPVAPIDAEFSIGSGADADFVSSFIHLTPESDGADFDAAMRKLVRAVGPELMGGAIVKCTVRCFVAALLKHLGLVSVARTFVKEVRANQAKPGTSQPQPNSLIDVWKKGSLMHRWIISQRQSLQQLHVAKQQQLEAEGKPMSAVQLSAVDKRLEYEGFCAGLFNKALYLLSARPCLTHRASKHATSTPGLALASEVSSTLALTRTLSNEVALVRSNSSGGRGSQNASESFLSLFSVYRTLQHFNAYKAEKSSKEKAQDTVKGFTGDENIVDLLALFVQADCPVSQFTALIEAQSKRAKQRLAAIEAMHALCQSLSFNSSIIGLLSTFSNPFRAYQSYPRSLENNHAPVGSHYYTKIESCDVRLRQRVRSAFLAFYKQLAVYIRDANTVEPVRVLALDCWAIEWIPLDHSQLIDIDILKALHTLSETKNHQSSTLSTLARAVLKLLFAAQIRFDTQSIQPQPSVDDDSESDEELDFSHASAQPWLIDHHGVSGLDQLQQQIIDSVFMDLYHSFQSLTKLRNEVGAYQLSDTQLEQKPPASITALSFINAEESSYLALSSLSAMTGTGETRRVTSYLISRNAVQLLLTIINSGTPRLQRMALALLGQLFEQLSPTQFDVMKLTVPQRTPVIASSDADSRNSHMFVHYLFVSIGHLMLSDYSTEHSAGNISGKSKDSPVVNPYDSRSGEINLSLSAAFIAFVRQILQREKHQSTKSDVSDEGDEYNDERKMKGELDERKDKDEPSMKSKPSQSVVLWSPILLALLSASLSSLPSMSQTQSFSLDNDSASPSLTASTTYPSLLLTIAAISILGGYGDRIRVGGQVQTVSGSSSASQAKEIGTIVFLDRGSGRAKVVFEHSPGKSIECEISKLRTVSALVPDSSLLLDFPSVLQSFTQFIDALQSENKAALQRKAAKQRARLEEYERERKEAAETKKAQTAQLSAPVMLEDQPWECEVCTFLNTSSLRAVCEMCGSNNPLARKLESVSRIPKSAVVSIPKPKTPRTALLEAADDEDLETRIEAVDADEFLYHVLRSRTLKSLCHLLQHGPTATFLADSQLLPALLSLATRPTQLSGFHSIIALEAREERLLELMVEKNSGIINDHQRFLDRAKGTSLDHSPFAKLTVLLPNSWDLGASRSISFVTDDCCTVQYSRLKDAAVGVVRSNHLIPNSLPAFYYEITVIDAGSTRSESMSFNIALGLFRSGMALKGFPGTNNSYAFSSAGDVHSTQSGGRVHRQPCSGAVSFKVGDVIGCLWNLRKKTIHFTVNGKLIGADSSSSKAEAPTAAFTAVDGRFYPAVWLEADRVSIRANWGQEPFKFEFLSTLPPGYLTSLSETSAAASEPRPRTAAEIKRRTQAEELSLITSFPIDLCEIALEQKSDDMERAVDFLLQNGHNELERMAQESIRQSQLMEEDRKMRILGVTDETNNADSDSEEDESLADWLTGGVQPQHEQPMPDPGMAQARGWAGGSGWMIAAPAPPQQPASGRRSAFGSSPASMLDDEIEQDLPVGVELPQSVRNQSQAAMVRAEDPSGRRVAEQVIRGSGSLQEQLKIDDISCGHVLTVSENAANIEMHGQESQSFGLAQPLIYDNESEHIFPVSRFAGRSGIVGAVNVNTKSVQLLFVDSETGVKHCRWFPVTCCTKPNRLWIDPCIDLRGSSWKTVAHALIVNEQALSVRKVRTGILKLLGSWPRNIPFSLAALGGSVAVMDMLKLSASELLSTSLGRRVAQSGLTPSQQSLSAFQSKLSELIEEEVKSFERQPQSLPAVRITESMYDIKQSESLMLAMHSNDGNTHLLPRIVEEIIVHFIQAVNHPTPALYYKSQHPYPSHSDVRDKVSIPGASKLLVSFDPACHIGDDMLTRLAFYRDSSYQDLIAACSGRYGGGPHGNRWQSFMVSGDTLYYKFNSGVNSEHWGYKFKVTPIELRINDEAALNGLNVELGSWLFEFFLTHTPPFLTRHYARDIYDAIVWYVCQAKPSAKSRGVELLVRFLLHMHQLDNESPVTDNERYRELDFTKLAPLQAQMNQVLDSMSEADYRGGLSSPALQGLIELLATTDLVKSRALRSRPAQPQSQPQSLTQSTSLGSSDLSKDEKSDDKSSLIDVSGLGVYQLKVLSARYYPSNAESQAIDVTVKLQQYVESCGSIQLYVPVTTSVLDRIIGVGASQWTGKEKKLAFRYALVRRMFESESGIVRSVLVKEVDKTITIPATLSRAAANPAVIIKPQPSPFDGVVELSRFTLEMQQSGEFNANSLQEVIRAQSVARSYFPLVSPQGLTMREKDRVGVSDSSGVLGAQFTFMTWIYLSDDSLPVLSRTSSSNSDTAVMTELVQTVSEADSLGSRTSSSASPQAVSSPTGRRGARVAEARPTVAASAATPLRCLLQKGNYNAELALSSSQSSGWSHAHAHLYSSGLSLALGPNGDNRLTLTLYTFRHPPQQLTTNQSLPYNQWSHVAVTVTRHTARIIVNGIDDCQRKLQGHRKLSTDPFFLGNIPVGSFDISDERYGAVQRGPGFEDETKRTGINATVRDARWVGYAVDAKDVSWYYKCATHYNTAFNPVSIQSSLQATWHERKVKEKKDKADVTAKNDDAQPQPQSQSTESETVEEEKPLTMTPPTALFSEGPLMAAADIRRTLISRSSPRFTPAMDSQIIEYVSNQIEMELHRQRVAITGREAPVTELSGSILEVQPYSPAFPIDSKTLSSYHLINQIPIDSLRARLVAIQTVNFKLAGVLPLVDFSQAASSWSLANRLSSMSWLILREVKTRAWSSILRQTGNQGTTTFITVNRPRALRAREKGDLSGMKSVFGQIYCQLHFIRPALLRTDQRPWRVTFEGEGGTDAGGLFRDSVSHLCSELQSPAIPLFIQCPNSRTKIGDNQDKWIPNPQSTSSIHLSMFAFVGKLMGIAIRGGHMLNLDFPSLVFKPLVGAPITRSDLAAIDSLAFDVLDKINGVDDSAADELMANLALTFTTMTSDGRLVELKLNGGTMPVTASSRHEYCQLVEQHRLHEFDSAIAAIRKGLSTIVPIQLLPLFTYSELESMICGKREIAIEYLRANTRYRAPITPTDRHVQMLWDALAAFSHEERQLFIRFVWGQSRLPANPADFTQKFEIWPHPVNNDAVLPVSHTCFFSLELPRYSTLEVMKKKILYAINNGYAIDTDHVADALDWNAD